MSGYVILSELACGHHALTQTAPRDGSWITCPVCQGQRKVTAADIGERLF